MDRLDKLSACAIAVLGVWALVLVLHAGNDTEANNGVQKKHQEIRRYIDPNYDKRIALAKKLIVGGSLEKADLLVDELVIGYAFEGQPYMLKGDIHLRKQQPVKAMLQYRNAIDLNPDFLDKKTPVFQGKKIKKTVDDAQLAIDGALKKNPGNTELKESKKTLYYMLRKIAGSCS